MPRVAVPLSCTSEVMRELERLSRSRTDEARLVERAKIVLGCLGGRRNDEVAAEFGTRAGTVATWRTRFAAQRDCATARARVSPRDIRGRKSSIAFSSNWSNPRRQVFRLGTAACGRGLGVSDDAVWRVLRQEGVQLRRQRSWCVSTDPEFSAKAADIIGLYLNPPTEVIRIVVYVIY